MKVRCIFTHNQPTHLHSMDIEQRVIEGIGAREWVSAVSCALSGSVLWQCVVAVCSGSV